MVKGINMKHQMDVLRQTACQALAKHAPRQALAREMKLKCSKLFLAQPPPASPPASPHNLDPVLLLRQAVKKALLRSHCNISYEDIWYITTLANSSQNVVQCSWM
jgi:hypothetical protein